MSNNSDSNILKYFFTTYRKNHPIIFILAIISIVGIIIIIQNNTKA